MTNPRRKFLKLAGGGIVLAAAAGAGGFLATRTPNKALRPWSDAGQGYDEPRLQALSYAILAPNPHNRQPWIADLSVADEVRLFADTDRLLKETDPFDRQITIGLGCFLELLVLAAGARGYRVDLDLFPQGADSAALDARPVAIARFSHDQGLSPDPLFAHVLERRSHKEPFDTEKAVGNQALESVANSYSGFLEIAATNEPGRVAELRDLTWQAFETEYRTPSKLQESIDLMRLGKCEIEANPDGIGIGGPFMESLILAGVLSREALADPASASFDIGLEAYRDICFSANAFVWVVSKDNLRTTQIEAGRAWLRINLAATSTGLGLHPLSQALQEYAEMESHYNEVHRRLAPGGGTVQMLGRLGYAPPIAPSPRWPVQSRLKNA